MALTDRGNQEDENPAEMADHIFEVAVNQNDYSDDWSVIISL